MQRSQHVVPAAAHASHKKRDCEGARVQPEVGGGGDSGLTSSASGANIMGSLSDCVAETGVPLAVETMAATAVSGVF